MPPRLPFEPVAMDPPVRREDDPPALISERAHPCKIFSARRKTIGQMDDLIALGAEQNIQGVCKMKR